jgi:WD40 repeat protein
LPSSAWYLRCNDRNLPERQIAEQVAGCLRRSRPRLLTKDPYPPGVRIGLIAAVALLLCGVADGGAFAGRAGLIAFDRAAPGTDPTLVTVDPATGAMRTLGLASEPAWSPDGSKLAYVRGGQVYVAGSDGSGETLVGPGEDPAWSPDGTKLVVSRSDGTAKQLVVVDLGDGTTTQLTAGAVDSRFPAWSPDGSTIAFTSGNVLELVPAAGGAVRPVDVLGATLDGGPSWSPDGSRLAFLDAGGQVWTTSPDGGNARQLTYTLGPSPAANLAARPAWSPDGSAIAFTSGADLCVTDLGGGVRRVTRSPQTTTLLATLPDWQPSGGGSGSIYSAPPGANDSVGCDWNPGVRVEMVDRNVSPSIFSLQSPQQVVFVNHLTRPLTVSTTLFGDHATVAPGRFVAFKTAPGIYDFTVAGYPDGVPRQGTFQVVASGSVAIDAHTALRYGTRVTLMGSAGGSATGKVTVMSQPSGATRATTIASLTPTGGRWSLSIAPKVTTLYRVLFGDAKAERTIRVMPDLRVSRRGSTVSATLRPGPALVGSTLFLFRLGADGWTQVRSARTNGIGAATFRNVPRGRYYVGFPGRGAWWGTADDPFSI